MVSIKISSLYNKINAYDAQTPQQSGILSSWLTELVIELLLAKQIVEKNAIVPSPAPAPTPSPVPLVVDCKDLI